MMCGERHNRSEVLWTCLEERECHILRSVGGGSNYMETRGKAKDLEMVCGGGHDKDKHPRNDYLPLQTLGETDKLPSPVRKIGS